MEQSMQYQEMEMNYLMNKALAFGVSTHLWKNV